MKTLAPLSVAEQAAFAWLVLALARVNYSVIAGLAGTQDMFVQKFVVADGHCNINAARTGAAFNSLMAWIREQRRPPAGELQ